MGGYSERYLENVIRIMEDLGQEAMNNVYEWADTHNMSGIDVFKDWIKDLATRFEEIWETFDEKDEVDYIEAILQFVASIVDIDPDGEKLPVPPIDDTRRKILKMCTPVRRQDDVPGIIWVSEVYNGEKQSQIVSYHKTLESVIEKWEQFGPKWSSEEIEEMKKLDHKEYCLCDCVFKVKKAVVV